MSYCVSDEARPDRLQMRIDAFRPQHDMRRGVGLFVRGCA